MVRRKLWSALASFCWYWGQLARALPIPIWDGVDAAVCKAVTPGIWQHILLSQSSLMACPKHSRQSSWPESSPWYWALVENVAASDATALEKSDLLMFPNAFFLKISDWKEMRERKKWGDVSDSNHSSLPYAQKKFVLGKPLGSLARGTEPAQGTLLDQVGPAWASGSWWVDGCLTRSWPFCFRRYRVVVPYPPQSEAEIELKEGDIVFVHKKREDGWYKGTLQRNGRTGLFPGSFVESFWGRIAALWTGGAFRGNCIAQEETAKGNWTDNHCHFYFQRLPQALQSTASETQHPTVLLESRGAYGGMLK